MAYACICHFFLLSLRLDLVCAYIYVCMLRAQEKNRAASGEDWKADKLKRKDRKQKPYMKQTTINDCKIIDIRRYSDNRGYLSVVEGGVDIPFEIKRIYYLYMVPEVARGAHAHKELQQLLIATSGSVYVTMDDGENKKTFVLDKPWKGLYVAPGMWRDLDNFSNDAVCVVLASQRYDATDYIRDYEEFLKFKNK